MCRLIECIIIFLRRANNNQLGQGIRYLPSSTNHTMPIIGVWRNRKTQATGRGVAIAIANGEIGGTEMHLCLNCKKKS